MFFFHLVFSLLHLNSGRFSSLRDDSDIVLTKVCGRHYSAAS